METRTTVNSIDLSDNALAVLKKRYLRKDEEGEPLEEPIEMFRRVAANIAEAEFAFAEQNGLGAKDARGLVERSEREFLDLMTSRKFMPNSPTLMNAGRELQQLTACFVLPVEDSIEGIYDTLKHQAITHKSGGGTGFGFSRLRPKNDLVKSTMGVSSGPVSFMAIYDASTDKIKQGGTRRGANMGILRCLAAGTVLQTTEGPRKIEDLVGERPSLYACHPDSGYVNVVQADRVFVSDRDRPTVRASFDDGSYLDCTPDHLIMLEDGTYREAAYLERGDGLRGIDPAISRLSDTEVHLWTIGPTGYTKTDRRSVRLIAKGLAARCRRAVMVDPVGDHVYVGVAPGAGAHVRWAALSGKGNSFVYVGDEGAPGVVSPSPFEGIGSETRRVASVENIPERANEVYDVSMPAPHNFCANGVFVHNCDHPDVEEFVDCKRENDRINNFNISVAITDEFMEAVEADGDFELRNPRDGAVMKTVRARDLFRKIVEGAWLNGEPGVVFIDKINADNPTPQFPIESTNPCSEAHLPPYDSCNLGSINLVRFVLSPSDDLRKRVSPNGSADDAPPLSDDRSSRVDWIALRETVRTAVRFLDNVIEANRYPLPEIEEMSKGNRRIGLGVMGFADVLVKLGVPYDSPKALVMAESLMEWIDRHAWEASRELAQERGVFANWEGSTHHARGDRVRNATATTIAPTGTISMIAGCSGGIEPLFAIAFMRRQAGMEMLEVSPEFVKLAKERGFYSEELMKEVARAGGVRGIEEVPEDVRRVWATSREISPEHHVRMQAAFQRHISMGISKTINLPRDAAVEDVESAYRLAYDTGCKGIAVYRDGSREAQVLSTGKTLTGEQAPGEQPEPVTLAQARDGRPRSLSGATKKLTTGHGPLYVTLNDDEFGPRECFVVLGKPGGTASAFSDALGRMISLALTHGASPTEVVHQLRGIQDGHPAGLGPNAVLSVPDGVAKAMAENYLRAEEAVATGQLTLPVAGACPDCQGELRHESGCIVCTTGGCGFSRCS